MMWDERAWGDGRASGVHGEGSDSRLGARARAERTSNMRPMDVTLDVSKLSGWLNAVAACRIERRTCRVRRRAAREA